MATTLTIGAVDQTAFIGHQSMTCKLNTLDLTLVDPATVPALGDAVALTDPTWAGTVVKVGTTDPVDRAGHVLVKIAATNSAAALASAAPFGLSDAPDNSTTYGYRGLSVETQANSDGTTTVHGACTIQQAGLWPAMTFLLTSANRGLSGAGFSVTNVTVTWPKAGSPQYAVEFGDAIVTMAVWTASQAGAAPPGSIDGTRITPGTVDTPQLRANSVTAAQILAGSITADKLAATLILASLLKTAAPDGSDPGTGLRLELDLNGLRAYDASNVLQVKIPSDGSAVFVSGQVLASELTSSKSALFQTAAQLAIGAVMTVQNNVADPTQPPVLVGSVPRLSLASSPAHAGSGLCYDGAGGAGGATPSFWVGATADDGSTTDVAYEYDASSGALLRTLRKTGSTTTATATAGATSHVADGAEGAAGSGFNSQVATPITLPSHPNTKITKVSVYMAGRLGTVPVRNCVWNTSGTILGYSAEYTAADGGATTVGGSNHYDKALTAPLAVSSGATIWAGWAHSGSGGHQWDRDSGSNTTKKGQNSSDTGSMTSIATDSANKPNVYVTYQYTVDSSVEGTMGTIVGIARQGANLWVLDDLGTIFQYNQADLAYVGKTTAIAASIAGAKAGAGLFFDGTNLIVTTATGTTASEQVRLLKLTTSAVLSSTLNCTGLAINGTTATVRGGCLVNDGATPTYWIALGGAVSGVYAFVASSGANAANRDFGLAAEVAGGVAHDGSAFRGWAPAASSSVWTFTTWDWSTATLAFWLAYSWLDDVGTPHETLVSPRASIALGRRRQLSVTLPAIPTGGADDPDKLALYMASSATEPAAAAMHQQTTTTAASVLLTAFNASGAADPSSNNFPGGTPAVIKSQVAPGWSLGGDGSAAFAAIATYAGNAAATYSPTITNGGTATYTTRAAAYYRLGAIVFWTAEIVINAAGSGGGSITIDLPSAPGVRNQIISGYALGFTTFANGPVSMLASMGSASAAVRDQVNVTLNRSHFANGALLRLTGFYIEA